MRLRFFFVINFCLLCSLAALPGSAAGGAITLHTADLEAIFKDIVSTDSPWARNDLETGGFTAQPATISLSDTAFTYQLLSPASTSKPGRKNLLIALLVNGKEEGRIKMSGDLFLYGPVVCATRKLERHQTLTADDCTVVRRNISMLDPAILTKAEEAIGKQLKTALQAGAVLYSQQLENPPLVKRGDLVTIMAQTGAVRVTVPGEVRETGALGDLVRVKNLMSRREIHARVLDGGLVETEL